MKKGKRLSVKLSFMIAGGILVLTLLLAAYSYRSFWNTYVRFYSEKAENTAMMLAELADGDKLKEYAETGEKDGYYEELLKAISTIKREAEVEYLYIFYPEEDSFTYIMDAYTDKDNREDIAELGDVYEYQETEYKYLVPDVLAGKASDQIILAGDVGYGQAVSAWAPVLDRNGRLAAMVEADYSLDRVRNEILAYELRYLAMILAGVTLILIFILTRTHGMVAKPLEKLTGVVGSYDEGKYGNQLEMIHTGDEIQTLFEAFDEMTRRIEDYIQEIRRVTAEKERIGAELAVATQIQASMLPCIFPAFPGRKEFDIYATMQPAKEVGGDFYDFFMVDPDHLAVVMADVSGKGVPAALFMVIAKTLIKNHAQAGEEASDVFTNVNRQLCESNDAGLFVTAWMGILTISTGDFVYVNAGHNPPLLRRGGGEFEYLRCRAGFVLAGMEGIKYKQAETVLSPGDMLYLYTDGVTEATDIHDELYGEKRLSEKLNRDRDLPLDRILHGIKDDLDAFAKGAPQFDDITMLVLKINERDEAKDSISEKTVREGNAV